MKILKSMLGNMLRSNLREIRGLRKGKPKSTFARVKYGAKRKRKIKW